ncbi:hypothetical protein V6N11_030484 [Hibiscus sabdariffa]|uniref:Tetratricopeptide repeat protein SKI3 n=1 Tax=Hibiscus sabdariffa TaxID=183260 RepID=A0ABR2PLC9_9ROSI
MGEQREEERRRLEELVESNSDDSSLHFQLGVCLWETQTEKRESGRALDKGRRPWSLQFAKMLLTTLPGLSGLSADWVHQKQWSEAVQSLQYAIRGYPTSPELWAALTAAIKSYSRAIELEDTRVFALVECGNIFLMLGSFRKGIEQFQQARKISPQNTSALYGLASGLLGMSKECRNSGAFRWASSLLEEACKVAKASIQSAGNSSCTWKIHGDILLTYAQVFPWMDESQSSEYNAESFKKSIYSWKNTCFVSAISARNSFQRALHLAPWQANIYVDIAISSNLISSFNEDYTLDNTWKLPEKLTLGAIALEGENFEFWVALSCLSECNALKQHALIRGLQLDVSLANAWAYLGKLYREENKKLARQAFDCARGIDPSLALPWAGMSVDTQTGDSTPDDVFESCLRAVEILPLADFQIGLAQLALHSGNLSSSQVFGAIQQAVQHAPHYHESHNLNGLVHEAHHLAGDAFGAVQECKVLEKEGMLDAEGLQIYAFSLWQLGEHDSAISVTKTLADNVSTMDRISAVVSVSFICRLLYYISGPDLAIDSILKMPKELFRSSKTSFVVSAINALDQNNRLESIISSTRYFLASEEEITGMHYLIALSKLIKHGTKDHLGFQSGISHLRKAIHMYPNSNLIRNLLGYLLLGSEVWGNSHLSSRCSIIDASDSKKKESLKSAWEIFSAGAVACHAIGNSEPRFSFPTCGCQCLGSGAVQELQKCLRREPWNHNARYLLVLNLLQEAREKRFPDFLSAEEFLGQPCSLTSAESCIFLCHGVASMEIARRCYDSQSLSSAIKSLSKVHLTSSVPIPVVSALLAQAEGSIGSRKKWERNLRLEWFSWPPGFLLQMESLTWELGRAFGFVSPNRS